MCLWCYEVTGSTSLPTSMARYTQFRRTFPTPNVRVVARVTRSSEYRALADYEFLDHDGGLVARIDEGGDVIESLHSRVGGRCHGVTAACETAQGLVIISKGHGRVLRDASGAKP